MYVAHELDVCLNSLEIKSMENGHLRVPIFGVARDAGNTVDRSWKEVGKNLCTPSSRTESEQDL